MQQRSPIAFLSYVRSDDAHDSGRITNLRQMLEGEVKMQTGSAFNIFQDRNDILWGQQWKERIDDTLKDVTFLIPVLTPSYFQSPACISEFEAFRVRERALGEDRLILPIYYVTCDELAPKAPANDIADVLKARNWVDWRDIRFDDLGSLAVRKKIAEAAELTKSRMRELEEVFAASKKRPVTSTIKSEPDKLPPQPAPTPFDPKVPVMREARFTKARADRVRKFGYYAYTKEYDEVITPDKIVQPADIISLHEILLDKTRDILEPSKDIVSVVSEKISALGKIRNFAVTLLVDNSGSMRGGKIMNAACWASVLSQALEGGRVKFEVLGFTTRSWKGGQSRERWIKDRKPERPGRLNDIRHIIYKSADETLKEADTNFGIMLREGVLKENMDGEALLWAASRLNKVEADRRIIIVMSDGSPVDDSTLSINYGSFLDRHLTDSVNWVRGEGVLRFMV